MLFARVTFVLEMPPSVHSLFSRNRSVIEQELRKRQACLHDLINHLCLTFRCLRTLLSLLLDDIFSNVGRRYCRNANPGSVKNFLFRVAPNLFVRAMTFNVCIILHSLITVVSVSHMGSGSGEVCRNNSSA